MERVNEQIHTYFSFNKDARFVRRLDALSLICDGHLISYVADLFKINNTTIQHRIHRLNQSGLDSLKDQSGRGRKPRLSDYAQIRLISDLKKSPKAIGYDQVRWDGKLLSYHLSTRYGVSLKVRQC